MEQIVRLHLSSRIGKESSFAGLTVLHHPSPTAVAFQVQGKSDVYSVFGTCGTGNLCLASHGVLGRFLDSDLPKLMCF